MGGTGFDLGSRHVPTALQRLKGFARNVLLALTALLAFAVPAWALSTSCADLNQYFASSVTAAPGATVGWTFAQFSGGEVVNYSVTTANSVAGDLNGEPSAARFRIVEGAPLVEVTTSGGLEATNVSGTIPVSAGKIYSFDLLGSTSVTGEVRVMASCALANAPSISSLSPDSGTMAGGTSLTITGTNFVAGATSATIGGTFLNPAAITVNSATSLTVATIPPSATAGPVNVSVTTPNGTGTLNNGYTYVAAPTLTSAAPTSGGTAGGTSVTLTGTDFTGTTAVTFGGIAGTSLTVVNATTLTVTTPAHAAGLVNVSVTTPGGTATLASAFTYVPPAPTLTGASPNSGSTAGGTAVTLTGTDFTGATSVTFDGIAGTGLTVVNATTLTVTTPARAAGLVNVTVTTPGGIGTLTNGYTYVTQVPLLTGVAPSLGSTAGGTAVTLTGTSLTGATSVTFGGTAGTGIVVNSSTSVTVTTPPHATGAVNVAVNTPGGTGTLLGGFTYVTPAPTLSSLTPTSGTIAGGTAVTLTGTNLTGAIAVDFGGAAGTGLVVNSATSITVTAPPHAAGAVNVTVTTPGGPATLGGGFTYVTPVALAFSPAAGALPNAMSGESYSQSIAATGGVGALVYSLTAGSLPAGMVLNVTTGELTGPLHANTEGDYSFTIHAQQGLHASGSASYSLKVLARGVTVTDKTRSVPAGSTPPPVLLDEGATGGPFTAAAVTSVNPPGAGTATIDHGSFAQAGPVPPMGWYLKFTPAPGFTGTARIGFQLTSALGTSNGAKVILNLGYDPGTVVNDTHALVQGYVQSRLGMIATTINVPGLVERRGMAGATNPGAAVLSPSANGYVASFSSSLVQFDAFRSGQAGVVDADPLRFNAWVDGTFLLHNRAQNGNLWGSFGMLSAGMDYLLNDKALIGLAFHYDRMSDPTSATTTLSGNGWLAGPYVSFEFGDGVYWDTSLSYGGSSNTMDALSWDGTFNTSRWLFDTQLSGQWQIDDVSILTPRLRVVYLSETVHAYAVTNGAGDVLAIQGFTTQQLRASLGGEIARSFLLDNGSMLTLSLDANAGLAPLNGMGMFGTIAPGLNLALPDGPSIGAKATLGGDSTGSTTLGIRASISGRF